jgi:hypothetical protein
MRLSSNRKYGLLTIRENPDLLKRVTKESFSREVSMVYFETRIHEKNSEPLPSMLCGSVR